MQGGQDEREEMRLSERAWSEAVARIWLDDPAFKAQLFADPRSVLQSLGAKLPELAKVKIVENTTDEVTFVLPLKPKSLGQLSAVDVVEMYGTCPCTACGVPTVKT